MRYKSVISARFVSRPNRFIAVAELDGREEICHVMNTGRMRELLVPGAEIFLLPAENPARKTKFDLVAVRRGDEIVNIDSLAQIRVGFPVRSERKYSFHSYYEQHRGAVALRLCRGKLPQVLRSAEGGCIRKHGDSVPI